MLKRKTCIFILWLILVSFLNIGLISNYLHNGFEENPINPYDLKSSGPEINITTPESITYHTAMEGYYPGTFSFEDVLHGQDHPSWTGADGDINDEVGNHKKVYEIVDNSGATGGDTYHSWVSAQDHGTIESWFRFTSNTEATGFLIRLDGTLVCALSVSASNFMYSDDSGNHDISGAPTPQINRWYHIRFDFRGSYGSTYQGLTSQYTYKIYIDGVEYGPYNFASNNDPNRFQAHTAVAASGVTMYWDAVGYSWDPDYNVGDNLNEGLLLSFDLGFTHDWLGYSLDGQSNKTILGDSSIPYPDQDGLHTIQVFGNDSIGNMYESDVRYFNTRIIKIITPENITYTQPMSGYYPATYGFEDSDAGEDPKGWTVDEVGGTVSVQSEIGGHKNVVDIYKTSAGSGITCYIIQTFENQTSGTIEWWWRATSNTGRTHIQIFEDSKRLISLALHDDTRLQYHDQGNWLDGFTYSANTWYWVSMNIDMTTDTYGFSIYDEAGDLKQTGSDYTFYASSTGKNFNTIYFSTGNFISGYHHYVDAVGYSWDPDYNLGANLNEGLLLSFTNSTNLDWKGYSLDGSPTTTILGNTTFSFPNVDGLHTIQVFGNDSLGTDFESDVRYFSIKLLNIITPENITYTQPMSGYYPATYGFENDENGVIPQDWTRIGSNPSITNEIIAELDGHKKVLHMDKGNTIGTDNHMVQFFDETQEYGTLEFWARTNDVSEESSWHLKSGTLNQYAICGIRMYSNTFAYWLGSGSGWQDVPYIASNNQWYHIKIQFECGTGNHYGLSQHYWRFFVNGAEFGDYAIISTQPDVSHINIHQNNAYANFRTYTDAIGYSWDLNYNIGDNRHEGLLLSFTNRTNLDWIGYTLDGSATKTILGNKTIPIPDNGLHSVQVFGNNSLGDDFKSENRYFTVDITITPPQITINSPQNGDFFGFSAPSFDLSIISIYLDSRWYTLDGGTTNIPFGGTSGTINQLEWEKYGHGPVTIRFYANDTFSQVNYEEITVNKDLNPPTSTLSFVPYSGINIVIETTVFTITANDFSESGVSLRRYRINGSGWVTYTGAFTLTGFSGGYYNISYQAIDVVGNIESEQSTLIRLLEIHEPLPGLPIEIIILIIVVASVSGALLVIVTFLVYKRGKSRIFADEKKLKVEKTKAPVQRPKPQKPKRTKVKKKKSIDKPLITSCPFCQAELPGNQKFCFYCGANLEE
jgi:hypothetical protein